MKKICLIGLVLGLGMKIASADLYRVSGIPISAELSSAKEARSAAIENGETDAFWALMKKMVAPDYLQQVPKPNAGDILNWVQTVSLANEKHTATKYMADLSVRFDPNQIQTFLTQNQIPFLMKDLPTTVIVPVFQNGENLWTLEEQNPLYAYLKSGDFSTPLWRITVPVGELDEIMQAREALQSGNKAALSDWAGKYNADSVAIIWVTQKGPYVTAKTTYMPVEPALENQIDVVASNGNAGSVMPNLWKKIVKVQEEKWRNLQTQNFETSMTFWAQIPIRTLSEWNGLSKKLKQAGFWDSFTVRAFRPNEVWVTFQYKGTSIDLNRQLHSLGMELTVGEQNGVWILRKMGGEL